VNPADLDVAELAGLLSRRELSAAETVEACLVRIRERDGSHSLEGDPDSVNAWIRVYDEDAVAAAAQADARLAQGDAPPLCGVPVGLKDLYAVAGKPLTASSRLLHDVPATDSDAWSRLREAGMVLVGHLHTHEFAVGGTTDQVGSPWSLDRSAGGSSGGSAAALAARMVPAATGTDTAGSLRIPSALSGTSTIKPTRGRVSLAGIVPLGTTLDHAGPMARTVEDCTLLLAALAGPERGRPWTALAAPRGGPRPPARPFEGTRLALSPRIALVGLDDDVGRGFDHAVETCRRLGATVADVSAPPVALEVLDDYGAVLTAELLAYHRRFDDRRDLYRPSIREWVEDGERRALPAEAYVAAQTRRRELTAALAGWLDEHRLDALLEPTVPVVAPLRGRGYDHAATDFDLISLTHYWNWTGFPVVALPTGVGTASGLPTSVSLIGRAGADWHLLGLAQALQAELGIPDPFAR
jgi:aspartyl-tRNA(Asn)/glutamyl-tRNA(Gln) amidotransferase subunit A